MHNKNFMLHIDSFAVQFFLICQTNFQERSAFYLGVRKRFRAGKIYRHGFPFTPRFPK